MVSNFRRLGARALVVWALWTLYATFTSSQNFLSRAYGSRGIEWKPAFRYALFDSYIWLALTPFLFKLADFLLKRRLKWWQSALSLVFGGLFFAVVQLFIFVQLLPLIGYHLNNRQIGNVITGKLPRQCAHLLGALRHPPCARVLLSLPAARIESQPTGSTVGGSATRSARKMQLQPHFLFSIRYMP